ncbi:TauD/TfdA family dioxygenase [Streptomyces sp. ME19-01-6]|uniref:TauD/TfdA family dioxygenase n=1 Tax=Streptomyces sp. ME19-01-6 TaxID=3028686 RepID=UPI0029BF131C|nr:TauD/TfdA family dioxygenase [Streptomyces sp. ME19-01-6]MDX3228151.1 TauD/TfdA family dioxygenase [Streptomyces sp. ME19-01-6]
MSANPAGLVDLLKLVDLADLLVKEKALVFRGFAITPESYEEVATAVLPRRLAYIHGNSPRTKVGQNVYTSTEYPPEFTISMHNEMSYAHTWPSRLLFFCEQAPTSGGATPVVDGQLWLESIDPGIRDAFAGGVRYIQNLHDGYGLGKSWQATFETDNPAEVETFLDTAGADWKWKGDGTLWISQLRPATVRHPVTGAEVWFNQADQFHVAGLGDDARELAELLSEDEMPQSVTFADGSPIPAEYITHIQETGLRLAVDVDWQAGSLLLIDNMLVGHGRRPFAGPRRVLVAMSD